MNESLGSQLIEALATIQLLCSAVLMDTRATARGKFWRLVFLWRFCLGLLPVLLHLGIDSVRAEERLWIKAEINGKPTRLAFDTGASESLIFPKTAEKLGLTYTNPPPNVRLRVGETAMGRTEECELTLDGDKIRTVFGVIEVPTMLAWDVDGVLGWKPLSQNIFGIDARRGTVSSLDEIPQEVANWVQLKLRSNSAILRLEVPGPRGKTSIIFVDTGSSNGVKLSPEKWREWKALHKNAPATLDAYYAPSTGLVVAEESWAEEVSFGELKIFDVPVTQASRTEAEIGAKGYEQENGTNLPSYAATFGLAALKRLDLIIDGQVGVAHLHSRDPPSPPYEHNRLGAVFTPVNLQANDLIGRVAERSPAQEAGIRNGDILLKIGDLDATKWRTDPRVMPLAQFWTRPPGTKLELTLKRGEQVFQTNVVLRQILSPAKQPAGLPK